MLKLYSRKEHGKLLHVINRKHEIMDERQELTHEDEFLQVSFFGGIKDKTFRPHAHIEHIRQSSITQESWVVINGKVEATYYDLDDKIITKVILNPGDCTITFRGGHNYKFLEDGTVIYEFKLGPYKGQSNDKRFLD